jgi:hypothetical protein
VPRQFARDSPAPIAIRARCRRAGHEPHGRTECLERARRTRHRSTDGGASAAADRQ